ncbi:hypothetical protein L3C95_28640 [Chitinophaga filiformis]|uniref:hypothetical protein n=1 Tax=Chitinophaga filiformis TaxID=104663 RepID=UPI001F3FDEC6|nr:hypothetical protein [Chitinophaga filiformis]MCF6406901.1 hypothetical protein [Chitinophaga filiformis]
MKKKTITSHRCTKRKPKGTFRKESREKLRMERYARTMAYIAGEDDYATRRMIETTKEIIRERNESLMMAAGGNKGNEECLVL